MKYETKYAVENLCYKSNKRLKPTGLMLHSVGCGQPDPDVWAKLYNEPKPGGSSKCVHAFIGSDKVVQTLPWDVIAWHAGSGSKGSANNTYIGIEMCEPSVMWSEDRKREFFNKTYANAVSVFADLCRVYDIDPMGIICHSEGAKLGIASDHADVMHWFPLYGKNMDMFRKDVSTMVEKAKMDNTPDSYARDDIEWALQHRILLGDSQGNLKLHEPLTRQDAICLIRRAMKNT